MSGLSWWTGVARNSGRCDGPWPGMSGLSVVAEGWPPSCDGRGLGPPRGLSMSGLSVRRGRIAGFDGVMRLRSRAGDRSTGAKYVPVDVSLRRPRRGRCPQDRNNRQTRPGGGPRCELLVESGWRRRAESSGTAPGLRRSDRRRGNEEFKHPGSRIALDRF